MLQPEIDQGQLLFFVLLAFLFFYNLLYLISTWFVFQFIPQISIL